MTTESGQEKELNLLIYKIIKQGQQPLLDNEKQYSKDIISRFALTDIEQGKLFYVLYGLLKVLLLDNGYEIKPK